MQTMMGRSLRCYIPSFVEIGLPVPKKKTFEMFSHIWAWWQSWSCDQHHMVIVPRSYQQIKMQNFVTNGPGVAEKIMF